MFEVVLKLVNIFLSCVGIIVRIVDIRLRTKDKLNRRTYGAHDLVSKKQPPDQDVGCFFDSEPITEVNRLLYGDTSL